MRPSMSPALKVSWNSRWIWSGVVALMTPPPATLSAMSSHQHAWGTLVVQTQLDISPSNMRMYLVGPLCSGIASRARLSDGMEAFPQASGRGNDHVVEAEALADLALVAGEV